MKDYLQNKRLYISILFGILFVWVLETLWFYFRNFNLIGDYLLTNTIHDSLFWLPIYVHDWMVNSLFTLCFSLAFISLLRSKPYATIALTTVIVYQLFNMVNHSAAFQNPYFVMSFVVPLIALITGLAIAVRLRSSWVTNDA